MSGKRDIAILGRVRAGTGATAGGTKPEPTEWTDELMAQVEALNDRDIEQ